MFAHQNLGAQSTKHADCIHSCGDLIMATMEERKPAQWPCYEISLNDIRFKIIQNGIDTVISAVRYDEDVRYSAQTSRWTERPMLFVSRVDEGRILVMVSTRHNGQVYFCITCRPNVPLVIQPVSGTPRFLTHPAYYRPCDALLPRRLTPTMPCPTAPCPSGAVTRQLLMGPFVMRH